MFSVYFFVLEDHLVNMITDVFTFSQKNCLKGSSWLSPLVDCEASRHVGFSAWGQVIHSHLESWIGLKKSIL